MAKFLACFCILVLSFALLSGCKAQGVKQEKVCTDVISGPCKVHGGVSMACTNKCLEYLGAGPMISNHCQPGPPPNKCVCVYRC
ncbi:hypothetical protein ABFS82_06G188400 [Erythranthe guttata]